jgi:hypothetical protein
MSLTNTLSPPSRLDEKADDSCRRGARRPEEVSCSVEGMLCRWRRAATRHRRGRGGLRPEGRLDRPRRGERGARRRAALEGDDVTVATKLGPGEFQQPRLAVDTLGGTPGTAGTVHAHRRAGADVLGLRFDWKCSDGPRPVDHHRFVFGAAPEVEANPLMVESFLRVRLLPTPLAGAASRGICDGNLHPHLAPLLQLPLLPALRPDRQARYPLY